MSDMSALSSGTSQTMPLPHNDQDSILQKPMQVMKLPTQPDIDLSVGFNMAPIKRSKKPTRPIQAVPFNMHRKVSGDESPSQEYPVEVETRQAYHYPHYSTSDMCCSPDRAEDNEAIRPTVEESVEETDNITGKSSSKNENIPKKSLFEETKTGRTKKPSEEDLLYLLMHRKRQRDQAASKDQLRLQYLENQNRELLQNQDILKQELKIAVATTHEIQDHVDVTNNELEVFKAKYQKLKAWALEMNNEYASIRQEGSDLKTALTNLRHRNNEMWKPVQSALEGNIEANKVLNTVKKEISVAQQSLQCMNLELDNANKTIDILEGKAVQETSIRKLIEEAKTSAEARCVETQKNNEKLIDALADIKKGDEKRGSQIASHVATQISAITTRWNAACKELGETKARLETCENQTAALKDELEGREAHHTEELERLQAQHQDKLRIFRVELEECQALCTEKEERLRIEHQDELQNLQDQHKSIQDQKETDLQNTISQHNEAISVSRQALQDTQTQLDAANQSLVSLMTEKENLVQEVTQLKEKIIDLERQDDDPIPETQQPTSPLTDINETCSTTPQDDMDDMLLQRTPRTRHAASQPPNSSGSFREPHRPNSAAKRHVDEHDERTLTLKRPKTTSGRAPSASMDDDLFGGNSKGAKVKASRKRSKNDRYTEKFNSRSRA